MLFNFFKKVFEKDSLIEGVYAHEYTDTKIRNEIYEAYKERFFPEITPLTNPEKFDPLNPPPGWAYDPYYECWFKL